MNQIVSSIIRSLIKMKLFRVAMEIYHSRSLYLSLTHTVFTLSFSLRLLVFHLVAINNDFVNTRIFLCVWVFGSCYYLDFIDVIHVLTVSLSWDNNNNLPREAACACVVYSAGHKKQLFLTNLTIRPHSHTHTHTHTFARLSLSFGFVYLKQSINIVWHLSMRVNSRYKRKHKHKQCALEISFIKFDVIQKESVLNFDFRWRWMHDI